MKPVRSIKGAIAAIVLMASLSLSVFAPNARADSPEASMLPMLLEAQQADRKKAELYKAAPNVAHFYNQKADQLEDVIRRIKRGEDVPNDDLQRALDNTEVPTPEMPGN